jgi:hypothetical protein
MLTARTAEGDAGPGYERHRPEQTLLYQIIEQHYPDFLSAMEAQDRPLPGYVQDEFDAFLQCGRLEQGFLRIRCEDCKHEHLVAFSWPLLRIPARAALVIPFTSQAPRVLPELWRPADGRKRCSVGGRCVPS